MHIEGIIRSHHGLPHAGCWDAGNPRKTEITSSALYVKEKTGEIITQNQQIISNQGVLQDFIVTSWQTKNAPAPRGSTGDWICTKRSETYEPVCLGRLQSKQLMVLDITATEVLPASSKMLHQKKSRPCTAHPRSQKLNPRHEKHQGTFSCSITEQDLLESNQDDGNSLQLEV